MARFSVLIVDDEPGICSEIEEYFTRRGVRASTAGNGLQALQAVQGTKPDAVLTDIRMPGMDGLTLIWRLKEIENGPVVFGMTGHSSNTDLQAILDAGAREAFSKPVRMKKLFEAVVGALESRPPDSEIMDEPKGL